jgi:RHH-type proline utilization regulon transcriptional repressor/proline dehydrogenase/delta 1-pyrroline-5-carboxylate dehydrogenase
MFTDPKLFELRTAIAAATRRTEPECVAALLPLARLAPDDLGAADRWARRLVSAVRTARTGAGGVDALMLEFSLDSAEGVALMCLAEALLRVPDRATADKLIRDKISKGDWRAHVGQSQSLFVNAAAWGLLISGKLVGTASETQLSGALSRLIAKGGEPLIRKGVDLAMRLLGKQFVTGETIEEALAASREREARGYRFSYDMLGEAALTAADAAKYLAAYEHAIHAIGAAAAGRGPIDGPGISVKLSALHPRYARAQRERVMSELLPRLKSLFLLARKYDIALNVDAEEAERLELSLDLLEAVARDPDLAGVEGIGFVVQAYGKRAPAVIDWIAALARATGQRFMVRLVKGAYWDAEIKRAQVDGQAGYPVYTRKVYTDAAYLACARKLFEAGDAVFPQFATHNAYTLAAIRQLGRGRPYEFQCLHGMGETLYDQIVNRDLGDGERRACRVYAPVGTHETLLAYLVRRLLENGANSSFVNRIVDPAVSIDELVADPVAEAERLGGAPHPRIALPEAMFGAERRNSLGADLADESTIARVEAALAASRAEVFVALPLIGGAALDGSRAPVRNPADHADVVGAAIDTPVERVAEAVAHAVAAALRWAATPVAERAACLERAADVLQADMLRFVALAVREAGKTWGNAVGEVREAIDFLRYYAAQARAVLTPLPLSAGGEALSLLPLQGGGGEGDGSSSAARPIPTATEPRASMRSSLRQGEADASPIPASAPPLKGREKSDAQARGVVVAISPWNFPLAIFIGQVSAALVAGNTVLAKPAEQTPLIAAAAVRLLHEAGVPADVLQFLPGRGETVGAALVGDTRIAGVIFTGSTAVARIIQRTLAQREPGANDSDPLLIAETGGINAMIVDSSALPEQVVADMIASAFDSAGQRCSALRVLCVQADIAERVIAMLKGAMDELAVGDPARLATDIGPVIDAEAQTNLLAAIEALKFRARWWHQVPVTALPGASTFVPPTVAEVDRVSDVEAEVFGPVLHVVRFAAHELDAVIDAINASGFGLTHGVHSRIDETIDRVCARVHAGNVYVNRNMIGAVVGVQPFGGEGQSGTGPKAGGPLYLRALVKDEEGSFAADVPQSSFELPGPTGESNTLRFAPRGVVACIAEDAATLRRLADAAAACGNRVVLPDSDAGRAVAAALGSGAQLAAQPEQHAELAAVLFAGDAAAARALRCRLADRSGAIVPLIRADGAGIDRTRLLVERAVCINTTAAGGNASLMTMAP